MKKYTRKLMFFIPLVAIVPLCLANNNSFVKVSATDIEGIAVYKR